MKVEDIAEIVHEINRTYCETNGDNSQKPWSEISDDIKQSAIDGVNYHLKNKKVTPEQSHQNWMEFKLKNGWRYGKVKSEDDKTHPSLVPYKDLPEVEKGKDKLFKKTVDSLSKFLD